MSCLIKREIELFTRFAYSKGVSVKKETVSEYMKKLCNKPKKAPLIIDDDDIILEIFTDGSVTNNGKRNAKGGYGIYVSDNEKYSYKYEEEFEEGPATNQKTELLAIHYAINIAKKKKYSSVIIYSDSMYSINCLTKWVKGWVKNGWKSSSGGEVKNKNLIKDIVNNIESCGKNISFIHVRSHKQEPRNKESNEYKLWYGNDMADMLAKNGLNIKN